jgi:FKBP-type peptidyl-prolyl cis-trans isomerase FklB
MKKILVIFLLAIIMSPFQVIAQRAKKKKADVKEAKSMQNELDSVSYAFGMLIGMNMKDVGFEIFNYDLFTNALKQVIGNEVAPFEDEMAREIVNNYVAKLMTRESENNLTSSLEFLEINSKEEGVVSLESGLQYQIMEAGDGAIPVPEDKVRVHYTGMLTDGTVFDSSYDQGEPVVIPLNMVIQGWSEALQLMSVGSRWKIFIPPHLGYGEMSPPGSPIKSNAVLIFDVTLLGIEE